MQKTDVEIDVLSKNNCAAAELRAHFAKRGIAAVNLVSSPGSGKTTLLEGLVARLANTRDVCVVEGDQQTENDARRIKAAGARAVQINTLEGCHLEAEQVRDAVDMLKPQPGGIVFIENVGNLVCPTFYDLGETARVVLASVTEGEDKPLKYPRAFESSQACIVTKCDLLPYLNFNIDLLERNILAVNPALRLMRCGFGMDDEELVAWLEGL